MILIIGLGNPGPEYAFTRHNAGFLALDTFAESLNVLSFKFEKKFNAEISQITINGDTVILAKPQTFMNSSGEAVQKLMQFYKIHPHNCWVIFDELDLPLGAIKIRKNGGSGTHNGLKSIVAMVGREFPRFRIGIESRGLSAPEKQDTHSFVLTTFTKQEQSVAKEVFKKTAESLHEALKNGLDSAMNKFNS